MMALGGMTVCECTHTLTHAPEVPYVHTWPRKTKATSAASASTREMTANRQIPQLRKSLMPASWIPLRMA